MDSSIYYSYDKICSYDAMWHFIAGGRGIGKTYGAKVRATKRFLKRGEQFIYLRRHREDLAARDTFFADYAHEFPEWDFRINGMRAECSHIETRDDKKRPWRVMGYFIALSQGQTKKGASFHNVRTIIFDEFILEEGYTNYLPKEHVAMMNFYSTVNRNRDGSGSGVKVFFLANAVSIDNPYFNNYGINPAEDGKIGRRSKGFIAYEFPDSDEYKNEFYKTRWGQFVQDTEYADYAFESQFADGHSELVMKKPSDAKYFLTLEITSATLSFWMYGGGYYHCAVKRPKSERMFTTIPSRMGDDKTLMLSTDKLMGNFRTAFRHGRMTFDKPATRNQFLEVLKKR